jgi:L-iditol 2-dehydrogenase
MKGFMLAAPGRLEWQDLAISSPGPGELLLQVRAALTCGTDLKTYHRGHPKIPLPAPFGHEFSGVVLATGKGTRFAPGDAVMAVHSAPCLDCFYCRCGQQNLCEQLMATKVLGAFAEQILLPAPIVACNVHIKPAHLSFAEGAFLEPLACVVHGASVQPMRPGEVLLILGAGPIGLLHLLLAKARGVGQVIVAGRRENRLAMARQLGADQVIDVNRADLLAKVAAATHGRGADQVIECTGHPQAWEISPQLVRKGGRILLYGGCPGGTRVQFDAGRLHYDEITLQGAFHFTPQAVRQAYELLASGTICAAPLISGFFPLPRLPEALELLTRGEGMKYALLPEGSHD